MKSGLVLLLSLLSMFVSAPAGAESDIRLVAGPAVSPDGSVVAFAWRGDIWTVATAGGTARQLTTHPAADSQPRFSPDGKQLAFVSSRSGNSQIHTMDIDGSQPTQVTFHTSGYSLEQWHPKGKDFLAASARDHFWRESSRFYSIPNQVRGGESLIFDAYGENGSWSADGTRLIFSREGTRWWRKGYRGSQASQIWMYDQEANKFQSLVQHETGCRYPLWHPDGKSFYYVSGESGSYNLWHRAIDSGEQEQLTRFDDDSVLFPAIAANGSVIVFRHLFDLYSLKPGGEPAKIAIRYDGDVPRDPTWRRTLSSATEVAFSKDGLEVAMIAGGDVWIMDTEFREPKQVTDTPQEEREIVFDPDGDQLIFISDRDGQADIWRAKRNDEEVYWWQNDEFAVTRITNDPSTEFNVSFSPDGAHIGYCKDRGDFWVMDADGKDGRMLFAAWDAPDYDWSPDSQWIVYSLYDDNFNRDIYVRPLDGSRQPFNISSHPDNDSGPVWSPDGKVIAFTGRRLGEEVDIYFVYLQAEDDEERSRDRRLEKALEKMKKNRKSAKKKAEETKEDDQEDDEKKDEKDKPQEDKKPVEVRIDFEGLRDRIRRISIADASESGLFWSHDSKKLAFVTTVDGKRGLYTVSPPDELTPKLLTTSTGSQPRWLSQGKQIVWLSGGVPASVSASGTQTRFPFSVSQEVDIEARFETIFMQAWRVMRDHFYDERLNNRNWDAVFRKYAPMARQAVDEQMLSEVINLMLGELNGSHLGFFARGGRSQPGSPTNAWNDSTAHFGLRFDLAFKGPGLRVRDVIYDSPAAQERSRILPGEIVVSIDGKAVDPQMDLTQVLNRRLDQDVTLQVRDAEDKQRAVTIRPISFGQARSLLYEHWVRSNRKRVAKMSDGRFGYLHIRGMNMSSFYRFEQELYRVAAGKDGIVIDVRENGGGSTTDRLLTALTQPVHAITVPRGGRPGYPQDRKVYASWHKPIVVLCNQNSFSNAEIFSHAIKALKRGQLVGVPTAGGVISTGGQRIMDAGFIRMPFRGWYLVDDGEDMELNGAVPHHIIWPQPGDMPQGIDRQLEKAVDVLKADVTKWQSREQPKLRKSSER